MIQGALGYLIAPIVLLEAASYREWKSRITDFDFLSWIMGTILILTLLQAVFLFPVRKPQPTHGGTSLKVSIAVAALLAVLLAAGAIGVASDALTLMEVEIPTVQNIEWWVLGLVVAAWIPATFALWSFVRKERRDTTLARLAARLFLGTIVEAVATVPIAVMIRRKTSCYCGTGSFFSLILCAGLGWFTLGPAIFLPMLAKRRQRWYGGHCDACGYDMSGCLSADRCPECGTGWKAPKQATARTHAG